MFLSYFTFTRIITSALHKSSCPSLFSRGKCVVFARNCKFASLTQYDMQYIPCNSALLSQEILFCYSWQIERLKSWLSCNVYTFAFHFHFFLALCTIHLFSVVLFSHHILTPFFILYNFKHIYLVLFSYILLYSKQFTLSLFPCGLKPSDN